MTKNVKIIKEVKKDKKKRSGKNQDNILSKNLI